MESNDESKNEFRVLTKVELLALSDEEKIKYLNKKRIFNFHKALESLKKSIYELEKVNKKMMEEKK